MVTLRAEFMEISDDLLRNTTQCGFVRNLPELPELEAKVRKYFYRFSRVGIF